MFPNSVTNPLEIGSCTLEVCMKSCLVCSILFTGLFLFNARVVSAQQQKPPTIEWQTGFGGSASDYAYAMLQTTDGGYIVTGFSASNDGDIKDHHGPNTTRDILVLRLDPNGKVLWHRSLGGSSQDGSPCLALAHGGGYIIAGGAASTDGDVTDHHGAVGVSDCWIVKLDTNGKTVWSRSYGGSKDEDILRIIPTNRGGYIFAARCNSNDGDVTGHHGSLSNPDFWVVEIDSVGKILWQKSYGGSGTDSPFGLARTDDSAYVLAGYSNSNDGDVSGNHGGYDIWVLKINDTGKVIWENSFGSPNDEDMNTVTVTTDGGYIVGGSAYYAGGDITTPHHGHHDSYDIWIFKLHRDGKLAWERSYGGTGHDYEQDVRSTPDGGCLISGYSTSNDGDVSGHHGDTSQYDGWIAKVDSLGKLEWQRSLGGTKMDGASGITLTRDGGCAIACNSASSDGDVTRNLGGQDCWIVKLAPFGKAAGEVYQQYLKNPTFSVFPNPASSEIHVQFANDKPSSELELTDVLGRRLQRISASHPGQTVDISGIPTGVYVLRSVLGNDHRLLQIVR